MDQPGGDANSLTDLLGPWVESEWASGLIDRCREAWSKPLRNLSRAELAMLLRQRVAVEHLLPVARQRVQSAVDDDFELDHGELAAAIEAASSAAGTGAGSGTAG